MTTKKDDDKPSNPRLDELEIELKELEVLTAKVELGYLRGEKGKRAAEAETAAIVLRLRRLDEMRTNQQHGPLIDLHRGVFRLESPVYSEVLGLAAAMQRWGDQHPGDPVTLYLFSPGGSVFHGFALYDTLRTLSGSGHEVTTVIRGFAGSMASVIFLAGDIRRIGAESYIHQHETSSGVSGGTSAIVEEAAFMRKMEEKVTRIYTSRTRITAAQFKAKIRKKDWYAEASEALALGLATVVD